MSSPVGAIPCPWPMSPWESTHDSAAAPKAEEPKGVGQLTSDEPPQATENGTRATQDMADGVAGTVGDEANQAGERWEQTMQASSGAAHAALEKAVEARDGASNFLQQAGSALGNAAQSLKDAVTPPQ